MANTPTRTGATGYIGGDVLYALTEAFRSSKIMALVRNESRASLVTAKFPYVTPVIGDLDSTSQITSEAAEADVVLSKTHVVLTITTSPLTELKRPGKLQPSSQRPSHHARFDRKQAPKARYYIFVPVRQNSRL